MTSDRWQTVQTLLSGALERTPDERPAYLANACAGDADLQREVESLLAGAIDDDFLEPRAHAGDATATTTLARLLPAFAGRYVVERELGRGGMATVYLARDLRHSRRVAIKVLHPELSAVIGAERFLKEIEVTASLQHPHILPLFDSGSADGLLYYVMPFVDGETLRERIVRERQLPIKDAVRMTVEAAQALEYAHRHGVVHRDVKPENLLVQDGHILVADFGIALAVQHAGAERLTRTGLSLGTPPYMAPEQAAGQRAIDSRADVYALGVVLYEMLAGEPPFTGPNAQAIVARVMTEEPKALGLKRRKVPLHVETAVRTALEKLPGDRFEGAAAFAGALAAVDVANAVTSSDGSRLRAIPELNAFLAFGILLATIGVAWFLGHRSAPAVAESNGPVRFVIGPDSGVIAINGPAISRDGRTIVYAHDGPDGARLYARRIDQFNPRPIVETENGRWPFFSPDGNWVGFVSDGAIRKVRITGGPALVMTRLPASAGFTGATWSADDSVFYAVSSGILYRVHADGGVSTRVVVADTTLRIMHPQLLPGKRALVGTVTLPNDSTVRVAVIDLATGRLRQFGAGFGPRYVGGAILYAGPHGELFRQEIDLTLLEPEGNPEQIASGLDLMVRNEAVFDAAPTGALVYRAGSSSPRRLTVTDRRGNEQLIIPATRPWTPRFSPDGRRIAYSATAPGRDRGDLWVWDVESNTSQRLTIDSKDNSDPQWSPDGRSIAYSADAPGGKDVLVRDRDGGPSSALTHLPGDQWPSDWARDGSAVLFAHASHNGELPGDRDIYAQRFDGTSAHPYLATPANESFPRVSPDSRWVAYASDESGRGEVYVQSYPTPGRKTLISSRGGVLPAWRRDGKELFYWRSDWRSYELVAASLAPGGPNEPPVVRSETPLFRAPLLDMFDVSPDGTRFVLVTGSWPTDTRLVVSLGGRVQPSGPR